MVMPIFLTRLTMSFYNSSQTSPLTEFIFQFWLIASGTRAYLIYQPYNPIPVGISQSVVQSGKYQCAAADSSSSPLPPSRVGVVQQSTGAASVIVITWDLFKLFTNTLQMHFIRVRDIYGTFINVYCSSRLDTCFVSTMMELVICYFSYGRFGSSFG